ncbi:sigma-70 family RNA polymerase sigma factor [Patescibacteria group bacterium]|nr:sigma-70 family RNA polymerase sigma factor [Patescibacteria group bacterium]
MGQSSHKESDETVAARVQQGDTEAFGILVDRYQAKLLRYGRKFIPNTHDIEDLVQDIFIKAYANIRSFNVQMRFSPWIYRIAHNEFINRIYKVKRLPSFTFDLDEIMPYLFANETADQEANEKDMRTFLNKSLSAVDPKYREPLILAYLEEMSYQEISDIMHIPVSTVGIRLNRGRKILKKIIEDMRSAV